MYNNEESIPIGIRESGLDRSELYITSKYSRGNLEEALRESLNKVLFLFPRLFHWIILLYLARDKAARLVSNPWSFVRWEWRLWECLVRVWKIQAGGINKVRFLPSLAGFPYIIVSGASALAISLLKIYKRYSRPLMSSQLLIRYPSSSPLTIAIWTQSRVDSHEQIELNPYNYAKNVSLLEYHSKHGIVTEAYGILSFVYHLF